MEGGDQPFTFREPFHAVRQGQQVTGAVRQPIQHARAQPQHHQAAGVRGQEEAQAEQDPEAMVTRFTPKRSCSLPATDEESASPRLSRPKEKAT